LPWLISNHDPPDLSLPRAQHLCSFFVFPFPLLCAFFHLLHALRKAQFIIEFKNTSLSISYEEQYLEIEGQQEVIFVLEVCSFWVPIMLSTDS
jgi:hypothetical protein